MSVTGKIAKVFGTAGLHPKLLISGEVYAAIERDDAEAVTDLLKKCPAALQPLWDDQAPPFNVAVLHDKTRAAEAIVRLAPQVLTDRDAEGRTLLLLTARRDFDVKQIETLLRLGSDLQARDKDGDTVLHLSVFQLSPAVAETLMAQGLSPDVRNDRGGTPLMLAADLQALEMMAVLLAHGADINAVDADGANATMHAIRNDNLRAATALIAAGGKVDFDDPALKKALRATTTRIAEDFHAAINGQMKEQSLAEAAQQALNLRIIVEKMHQGLEREIIVKPLKFKNSAAPAE